MTPDVGTVLRDRWLEQGISINPGAAAEALQALEARLGTALPAALRSALVAANGMAAGVTDAKMFRLWPVSEIAPNDQAQAFWVFADWCLWSHGYAFDPKTGEVFVVGGTTPIQIATSLDDWYACYLDDSDSILP